MNPSYDGFKSFGIVSTSSLRDSNLSWEDSHYFLEPTLCEIWTKGFESYFTRIRILSSGFESVWKSFMEIQIFSWRIQIIFTSLSSIWNLLIQIVTPRPEKGRHVATAACPRLGPSFSGSIQAFARLMLYTRYESISPLKIQKLTILNFLPKFRQNLLYNTSIPLLKENNL